MMPWEARVLRGEESKSESVSSDAVSMRVESSKRDAKSCSMCCLTVMVGDVGDGVRVVRVDG